MKTIFLTMFLALLVVNAGEKSKLIQEADDKINDKDYMEAFVLYKKACLEEKSGLGCGMAGMMLYGGWDKIKQDKHEGISFIQKACEMGEMGSCVGLGEIILDNNKDEKSLFEARDLFEKGCEANISNGCAKLGLVYYMDWSMQDKKQAIKYFKKACEIKDNKAQKENILEISDSGCFFLGKFYLDDKDYQDYKKAIKYLTKSCDLLSSSGCANLGQMYEKGLGAKKDNKKAFESYEKACILGSDIGCYNLSVAYQKGTGVKRDIFKSFENMKKSCDLGLGYACFAVGYKYQNGEGIKKSNEKMNEYYQKACELKNPQGCFNLGASYVFGWGYEKNIQKAKELYGRACELKLEEGCKKYAELYSSSSSK